MIQNNKICLLGAHPEEHSVSMEVYKDSFVSALPNGFYFILWPVESNLNGKTVRWKRFLGRYLLYPIRVFILTRVKRVDAVHILDHSSLHLLPWINKKCKVVVTLHDLIPLRFNTGLDHKQVERFRKAVSNLEKVDGIVSVSDYSKGEALRLFDLTDIPIKVIHNGVKALPPTSSLPEIDALRAAGAEIIMLSLGSNLERKNLSIIPKILKAARIGEKVGILRVGSLLHEKLKIEFEQVLGDGMFVELGRVSTENIWNAYHGSDIVIVPSIYEGFGLPVIEALSAGKILVCSNSSSLPEVAGEHAHYFSPDSVDEGALALEKAVASHPLSGSEIILRKEYTKKFNWEQHVERCCMLYKDLLLND